VSFIKKTGRIKTGLRNLKTVSSKIKDRHLDWWHSSRLNPARIRAPETKGRVKKTIRRLFDLKNRRKSQFKKIIKKFNAANQKSVLAKELGITEDKIKVEFKKPFDKYFRGRVFRVQGQLANAKEVAVIRIPSEKRYYYYYLDRRKKIQTKNR